jgi:hypothetical protein
LLFSRIVFSYGLCFLSHLTISHIWKREFCCYCFVFQQHPVRVMWGVCWLIVCHLAAYPVLRHVLHSFLSIPFLLETKHQLWKASSDVLVCMFLGFPCPSCGWVLSLFLSLHTDDFLLDALEKYFQLWRAVPLGPNLRSHFGPNFSS